MISVGNRSINTEELSKYNDFSLLEYYFGITEVPSIINSPLRVDNNPSFSLYWSQGKIYFYDFGTKETGDIYDLIGKKFNLTLQEVLLKIISDNPKSSSISNSNHIFYKNKLKLPSNNSLEVKTRDLQSYDIEYWESYGISKEMLKFSRTYPISHIIITKENGKTYYFPAEKYAYVYIEFKDNILSMKIYQPYSKRFKWTSKHDSSVWDMWEQLPSNGNNLIITSSRKDSMCIWENSGIPSVSLQSESYLPKKNVVQQLKDRFRNVYVLYDNDFTKTPNWGFEYGKKISQEFDIKQLLIPIEYQSKDISDLCKNYGREEVNKFILKQISK